MENVTSVNMTLPANSAADAKAGSKKIVLPMYMLICLVVSSVIGGGIFALPQNMASVSGAGGIMLAWLITGVGMTFLAVTFNQLSIRRPDIDTGMYGYVQSSFGDYIAFFTIWGMWNLYWIANAGLIVLFFSALSELPGMEMFKEGLTGPAIAGEVILAFVLAGIFEAGLKLAAIFNVLMTIAKLLPLFVFALFTTIVFKLETFSIEFMGTFELGSTMDQVKNCMLYTAWVYAGIETATTFGSRGKTPSETGKATVVAFIAITAIYILTCFLALGVVPRNELAAMANPSMAGVLSAAVGPWGGIFVNIGMMISVFGCLVACTMTMSEYLYNISRGDRPTAPRNFAWLNPRGVPSVSLWVSTVLIAVLLIYTGNTGAGYNELILLCTSLGLIPYFLTSISGMKNAMESGRQARGWLIIATVAMVYSIWLIYAGGMKYVLLSSIPYAIGIACFMYSRKEQERPLLSGWKEICISVVMVLIAIFACYEIYSGRLAL